MSKKKLILIFISLLIVYLVYSNIYLIKTGFNYLNRPKGTLVNNESSDSLNTENSLEDFLINAEKKRQSDSLDVEKNPVENTSQVDEKKSVLSILKNPKKQEPGPDKSLDQVVINTLTIEEVQAKYMSDFKSLENSFKASIDSLISNALVDYQSGKLAKRDIAKKYLDQGKTLEEKSDKEFYILLDQMKKELKANQLSLDITNDIKTYYEAYKNSEKNKLVEKGMSIVKKD